MTRPEPGPWERRAWPGWTANGAGTWSRGGSTRSWPAEPAPRSAGPGQALGLSRSGRVSWLRSLVEGVDVRGEVLGHHAPADLERRRQVAVLLGEVDGEDPEPADRLGPGDCLV